MNLKDLKLHLPDEQAIKNSLVSTNTAKLKQELDQLPYGNMPQALDQVIEKLALINRTQIATNLRFDILGCFLPSFQMFFDHLINPENHRQASAFDKARNKLSELCREMSFGYKLTLLTFPEVVDEFTDCLGIILIHGLHGIFGVLVSQYTNIKFLSRIQESKVREELQLVILISHCKGQIWVVLGNLGKLPAPHLGS